MKPNQMEIRNLQPTLKATASELVMKQMQVVRAEMEPIRAGQRHLYENVREVARAKRS